MQNPTTYSHVYLRIQPYTSTLTLPSPAPSPESPDATTTTTQTSLHFLLYFSDPAHELVHTTVSQGVPAHWLELWEKYAWVEDLVVEALRVGVEVVGQEYIASRMRWDNRPAEEEAGAEAEDAPEGPEVLVEKPTE